MRTVFVNSRHSVFTVGPAEFNNEIRGTVSDDGIWKLVAASLMNNCVFEKPARSRCHEPLTAEEENRRHMQVVGGLQRPFKPATKASELVSSFYRRDENPSSSHTICPPALESISDRAKRWLRIARSPSANRSAKGKFGVGHD